MHFDSKEFLNGKVSASDSDKSAYKFELTDIPNSGMVFKIIPKFKLR